MPIVDVQLDLTGILKEIESINNVPLAAEKAMRRYIDEDVYPAFLKTIESWDNKPLFSKLTKTESNGIIGQVWTDDNVYHILDGGAKPHPITATKGEFLHFQTGFTPKTRPRWIGSQSGGKDKSSPWAHVKFVDHPGVKAREWAKTIAEDTQSLVVNKFREELRKL